jgi:hypothetical protein
MEGGIAAAGLGLAVRPAAAALRVTRVDIGSVVGFLGTRLTCVELAFDALTADFSTGARAELCDAGCRDVRSAEGRIVAIDEASTKVLLEGARDLLVTLILSGCRALFSVDLCELGYTREGLGFAVCALDRWGDLGCWFDVNGVSEGRADALEVGFSNRVYRFCEPTKVSRSSSTHD